MNQTFDRPLDPNSTFMTHEKALGVFQQPLENDPWMTPTAPFQMFSGSLHMAHSKFNIFGKGPQSVLPNFYLRKAAVLRKLVENE